MSSDVLEGSVSPRQPAWRWDADDLVLRPRCPECDGRVITSGKRLICLIVGNRHYNESTEAVKIDALRALGGAA